MSAGRPRRRSWPILAYPGPRRAGAPVGALWNRCATEWSRAAWCC